MGNYEMKTFFIMSLIWLVLLALAYTQEKPDSTKIKLKKLVIKQEKQTAFDSLMIKIAKEDSIKQSKKKK